MHSSETKPESYDQRMRGLATELAKHHEKLRNRPDVYAKLLDSMFVGEERKEIVGLIEEILKK